MVGRERQRPLVGDRGGKDKGGARGHHQEGHQGGHGHGHRYHGRGSGEAPRLSPVTRRQEGEEMSVMLLHKDLNKSLKPLT